MAHGVKVLVQDPILILAPLPTHVRERLALHVAATVVAAAEPAG